MKRKAKIFIILSLLISNLTFSQKTKSYFIPPYSLPETSIKIAFIVNKTIFIPGPYYQYAEKFLGIKDVVQTPDTLYEIEKIILNTFIEPDPEYYFADCRNANAKSFDVFKELENKGLIINPATFSIIEDSNKLKEEIIENPFNKGLSVKKNLNLEKKTTYKRIMKDSIYIEIPQTIENLVPKTIEQKAEEAANFIIKIRKRTFKVITGQDNTPQEKAMLFAINELKHLEEEYLSLFTGEKIITKDTIYFNYTPLSTKGKINEVFMFFYSENHGISYQNKHKDAKSIFLIIEPLIVNINENKVNTEKKNKCSLCYRLPVPVYIKIKMSDENIFQSKIYLFQEGKLIKN